MTEQITESFLALLPVYGPWLLGLTTYLSCLALPVPSSLMMIASGAFVASGDLSGAVMVGSAFGGAVLGDQTGFHLGRRASRFLPALTARKASCWPRPLANCRRKAG